MNSTINVTNAVPPLKVARRWQISVRSLLIFVTACCVVIAMFAFPPLAIISLLLALSGLTIFCLTASIYGRGWIRPFAVLTVAAISIGTLLILNTHVHGPGEFFVALLIMLVVAPSIGILAAATHGFLLRRIGIVPVPNVPFLRNWLSNPDAIQEK